MRRRRAFLIAAAAVNLCCGPIKKAHLLVPIIVAPEANIDWPLAVDVVSIGDKDLAKTLSKTTAADWFQKRDQYRSDYPNAKTLSVHVSEWTPDQVVPKLDIPIRRRPKLILVFANYSKPGEHRATLDPSLRQQITLDREDIKVESAKTQPFKVKKLKSPLAK
jgi:type VI secretion system protein